MNLRRWLTPGIGIKRWMLLVFVGLLFLALAFAYALRQATRELEPGGISQSLIDLLTLSFLPAPARVFVVAGIGLGCVAVGAVMVIRAFMNPFRSDDGRHPLVEVIYQKRFLSRGPRIVAIGGGTGLSTLLRGLKEHTSNLTAVVTVADDGGSSGVLRNELGIPPVGDIRNCIAALADAETMMDRVLQYRFPDEASGGDGQGLAGHAMGNLLIAAMTAVEDGDFEEGVRRINKILAVRGQVVPVSATPLTLHARLHDGQEIVGQSTVMRTSGIERVWLSPEDVLPSDDALEAIADAELIVLGPGQPVHEPPAQPADPGHPRRRRVRAGPEGLRVQRRDAGRRDDRLRPGRPPRGAHRAHAARSRGRRPREHPFRRADPGRLDRPARWPALAAEARAGAAARARARRRSRERPPPRPRTACGGAHGDPRTRDAPAAALRQPVRQPDGVR